MVVVELFPEVDLSLASWKWLPVQMLSLGPPAGVPPLCRVAHLIPCLSLWRKSRSFALLGFQGEGGGGVRIDHEEEGKGLALADLGLAESQALRCQGGIFST